LASPGRGSVVCDCALEKIGTVDTGHVALTQRAELGGAILPPLGELSAGAHRLGPRVGVLSPQTAPNEHAFTMSLTNNDRFRSPFKFSPEGGGDPIGGPKFAILHKELNKQRPLQKPLQLLTRRG